MDHSSYEQYKLDTTKKVATRMQTTYLFGRITSSNNQMKHEYYWLLVLSMGMASCIDDVYVQHRNHPESHGPLHQSLFGLKIKPLRYWRRLQQTWPLMYSLQKQCLIITTRDITMQRQPCWSCSRCYSFKQYSSSDCDHQPDAHDHKDLSRAKPMIVTITIAVISSHIQCKLYSQRHLGL